MNRWAACLAVSLLIWIGLLGLHAVQGVVYLDSGFYLQAARSVMRGELPYQDFFYVQLPVYPFVYGPFHALFGEGLATARLLSCLLALGSWGLGSWIGYRLGGRPGACLAAILLAVNPFEAHCLSVAKLYSLAAFWLVLAGALSLRARSGPISEASAMAALVLAVGTRMTLAPAGLVLGLFLVLRARRSPGRVLLLLTVGLGGLLALLLPFWLADPERMGYFILGIHRSAAEGIYRFGWGNKARALGKLAGEHLLLLLALATVVISALRTRKHRWLGAEGASWLALAGVTGAHLAANWFDPSYQSVLFPLAGGLVGGALGQTSRGWSHPVQRWAGGLLVLGVAATLLLRGGAALDPGGGLAGIRSSGELLARSIPADGTVLTCNALYPIAARREPAPGFEGAPFTFNPGWSDERCRRFHGVNEGMIIRTLDRREPAALSLVPESFDVGFPGFYPVPEEVRSRIWAAVDRNYRPVARMRGLVGAGDRLGIYLPREDQR